MTNWAAALDCGRRPRQTVLLSYAGATLRRPELRQFQRPIGKLSPCPTVSSSGESRIAQVTPITISGWNSAGEDIAETRADSLAAPPGSRVNPGFWFLLWFDIACTGLRPGEHVPRCRARSLGGGPLRQQGCMRPQHSCGWTAVATRCCDFGPCRPHFCPPIRRCSTRRRPNIELPFRALLFFSFDRVEKLGIRGNPIFEESTTCAHSR